MSTSLAVTLRRAAQVIRQRGWCQGQLRNWDGSVCALGALEDAVQHLWLPSERDIAVMDAAQAVNDYVGESPARWNDRPGRTAEQVTGVLNAVADQLDAAAAPLPSIEPAWREAYPAASPLEVYQGESR